MRILTVDVPHNETGVPNVIRFANSSSGNVQPVTVKLPEDLKGKRLRLINYRYKVNGEDVTVVTAFFLIELVFNTFQAQPNNITIVRSYNTSTAATVASSNLIALPYGTQTNQASGWTTIECPQSGAMNLSIRLFNQIMGVYNSNYDTIAFEYLTLWFEIIE